MEFDQNGFALWQKSFGGPGLDQGQCIKPDLLGKGMFSLAGYSYANGGDVSGNYGLADFWVVHIQIPAGLHADFTAEPLGGNAPLTVKCTDMSTGDPDRYDYDFGDGVYVSGPNPSHTDPYPSIFTITQTITKFDKATGSLISSSITKTNVVRTVSRVPFCYSGSKIHRISDQWNCTPDR